MTTKRLPRGFRRSSLDNIACRHRDVSCCPDCAAAHDEIVYVMGSHYWIGDAAGRSATIALLLDGGDLESAEAERYRAQMKRANEMVAARGAP